MSRIKIKHFGPVKEGLIENDGWIDIKKVTLFIGNQGSGKSTVAKLISTLSWMEKAIVKGVLAPQDLNTFKRFQKLLRYQRIDHYLEKHSKIEFEGKALSLSFDDGGLHVKWQLQPEYKLPKIMYVPAERNFLAVVDRPDKLKNLPLPLYTFLDEYDLSRHLYAPGVDLPIGNIRFVFDKQNKLAHIVDNENNYTLRLSEAASGFQSTIPLYLVSKFLAEGLDNEKDASIKELSLEEQRKQDKIKAQIRSDKQLSAEERTVRIKLLDAIPACFLNIVEEPEQNLFPASQWEMLKKLLEFNNLSPENKLIMTTHSPYLINFMSIAIQASSLKKKIETHPKYSTLITMLEKNISAKSTVDLTDAGIYQLNEVNGTIQKLPSPYGIPSDKNYLNLSLRHGNEMFDRLLEIEQEL